MAPIKPEPYDIAAEDAVELMGRSFNFVHHKGLVEWIKNSWDAYQRIPANYRSESLSAILETRGSAKSFNEVSVTDFCGMTSQDIDQAFKRWFDMRAATGHGAHSNRRILGGHGNGGKFYMRQMFRESVITTWMDGKLNSFGFNAKKEYGYYEGLKERSCSLLEALEIADISEFKIPERALELLQAGQTGFTVVRGIRAVGTGAQTQTQTVIDSLRRQPQMLLLLPQMQISVWHNDEHRLDQLLPNVPSQHPDISAHNVAMPIRLPQSTQDYIFAGEEPAGHLNISVTDKPLTGQARAFNRLDITGRFGIVASYPMSELPISQVKGAEWIMALLSCAGVEDEHESLVENARDRLIPSPKTEALLAWAAAHIDKVAQRVEVHNASERRHMQAEATARLTRSLNRYAQRFLRDFYVQVLGGPGIGAAFGGEGGGGGSVQTSGKNRPGRQADRGGNAADNQGGGRGERPGRVRRFPAVLVAGIDADPLDSSGATLELGERYPTLYQRTPADVDARLYWINTQAVYPRLLLEQFGEDSPIWKNYVLMRHRDVVVKEALRHLTETEGFDLTLEQINNRMDELTDDFFNSLDQALADVIFETS